MLDVCTSLSSLLQVLRSASGNSCKPDITPHTPCMTARTGSSRSEKLSPSMATASFRLLGLTKPL